MDHLETEKLDLQKQLLEKQKLVLYLHLDHNLKKCTLELEREEAILAAARADLAKILNLSESDDEDGMVRQIAGTELAAYILREYHTCTFTTSPFNGYVYAMYKYSMHPYSIHDPCKHD